MSHPSPVTHALRLGLAAAFLIFCAHSAHAAGQTFVSAAKGDDANPCDYAAPCRTFAGALLKTDVRGEVAVLDSGEYGPFVVTFSVKVTAEGVYAGVTSVWGSDGVKVEPPAGSAVTLRGLNISSKNPGAAGIYYGGPGPAREEPENPLVSLHVEGCAISGFTAGIDFAGKGDLLVKDTTVRDTTFLGVKLGGGATDAVRATIVNSRVERNHIALRVHTQGSVEAALRDTVVAGNKEGISLHGEGVRVQLQGGVLTSQDYGLKVGYGARAAVVGCLFSNSGTGLHAHNGGVVHLTDTTITNNEVGIESWQAGVAQQGYTIEAGKFYSFGNNRLFSNVTNKKGDGIIFTQQPF